jgi:hypothetical protein
VPQTPEIVKPSNERVGICPSCGQRVRSEDERKRRWFLYGIALAWLPFVPLIVGLVSAFRGISEQKATGIGAVAGGAAQLGTLYFIALTPVYLVCAIGLLVRSFSKAHPARSIVATISLCWTVLVSGIFALCLWWFFVAMRRP